MNLERTVHIDAEGHSASTRPEACAPQQHGETFLMAQALISSRQKVSAKRLIEPGPSAEQLDALLSLERMVSMGAAIQNLLLGAHAIGFGAGLTSGQAMASQRLHDLCGLADGEAAVCCINIGTVTKRKASARVRPAPAEFVSELAAEPQRSGLQ